MVKVAVFIDGFTSIGHAEYDEYGKDIVCSAISAITQTIVLGLDANCDVVYDIYEGNISLHIAKPTVLSTILLRTMMMGLKEIEKQYPNHIKVKGDL